MPAPLPFPALRRLTPAAALSAALLAGLVPLVPVAAHAQGAAPSAPASAPRDDALWQAFGQRAGLQRLADDFVERLRTDPRIGHFFKDTQPDHLKQQLADQFCELLGGGCVYDGETMKDVHADLAIARKDFLALVELLQEAMDRQGVPVGAQNRLLARLAPMHREIVTAR